MAQKLGALMFYSNIYSVKNDLLANKGTKVLSPGHTLQNGIHTLNAAHSRRDENMLCCVAVDWAHG